MSKSENGVGVIKNAIDSASLHTQRRKGREELRREHHIALQVMESVGTSSIVPITFCARFASMRRVWGRSGRSWLRSAMPRANRARKAHDWSVAYMQPFANSVLRLERRRSGLAPPTTWRRSCQHQYR